jgi:hypothetical protein
MPIEIIEDNVIADYTLAMRNVADLCEQLGGNYPADESNPHREHLMSRARLYRADANQFEKMVKNGTTVVR